MKTSEYYDIHTCTYCILCFLSTCAYQDTNYKFKQMLKSEGCLICNRNTNAI